MHLPGEHQTNHFVVGDKGPERIIKCRGFILLNQEVGQPGGAITRHQRKRQQFPLPRGDAGGDARERGGCAYCVQRARGRLAMLGDIVRPELFEGIKSLLVKTPTTAKDLLPSLIQQR